MKKNLATFIFAPRWGVGAVLLALCAFTPVSRADVIIVDNTGNGNNGHTGVLPTAQVFTMPSSGVLGGASAAISSLTLTLGGSGTAEVYVYAATSGSGPNSAYNGAGNALYDLGSVGVSGTVTLTSPSSDVFSASGTYAIVLGSGSSITWGYTDTSGSSNPNAKGTLGGSYEAVGSVWNLQGSSSFQMDLAAVPEVPMTGAVMGFGVLAIAVGHTLRRKLTPAA
jgi:hypothetical protein